MSEEDETTFTKAQLDAAVKAAVANEVGGLQTKNAELLGKLDAFKPYREALGDTSAEEVAAALALKKEMKTKKLRDEGDFDALRETHERELEALRAKHGELEGSWQSRQEQLTGSLQHYLAESAVTSELAALDGSAKVMLPHIMPFVRVIENEKATTPRDRFKAVVVDANGTPRTLDGAGTPFPIKDLVGEFAVNPDYDQNFGAGPATGSGSNSGNDVSRNGKKIIVPKGASTADYRAAREKAKETGAELVVGQD